MKFLNRNSVLSLLSSLLVIILVSPSVALAVPTNPSLGQASSFSILSGTYTNTAIGTTLNGDLGYVTGPAVAPTVNGHTYVADGTYNQVGIDQGTALSALNVQPCTFNFTPGAVDLATDTTHPGGVGVYEPGVYCIDGAASIGGGGTITLVGSGTFIFRMTGALNTSANSIVTLSGDGEIGVASACSVWWTPGAATTLGADSTFVGTDIDASGITIGSNVTWAGRALAFGGTVSTATDTINTVPGCAAASTTPSTPPVTPSSKTPGVALGVTTTPGLPNTGYAPKTKVTSWWTAPIAVIVMLSAVYLARKQYSKKV